MNRTRYFTVGPSALLPDIPFWTQEYFELGLGSISHRSVGFQNIYKSLDEELRRLMNIPSSHAIFIANSGSEIMERILQNTAVSHSFHFVTGSFSNKFYDYALRLGIAAVKLETERGFTVEDIPNMDKKVGLICLTHNETSTGIKTSEDVIHEVKRRNLDKIVAVDCVSSAPFCSLDFSLVDIAFFSSQKAFGLPPGLGIFIINKDLAHELAYRAPLWKKAAHNTLLDYLKNYPNFQTPSTPNTLCVFLMAKVAEQFNSIGIDRLYSDLYKKKERFYHIFQNNNYLKLVNNQTLGSDTVMVTAFLEEKNKVRELLDVNKVIPSLGYGMAKNTQLRFANFPANTMEDIAFLEQILSR